MLGEINNHDADQLLNNQFVGRLGCSAGEQLFVVPITFAYDGKDIYAHSAEGMKINLMRQNNRVCLEVDDVVDMKNWKSVVVFGKYEELTTKEEMEYALTVLNRKIGSIDLGETATPPRQTMTPPTNTRKSILYRIKIERKTGRFEQN
jgi:nitroimidazol reductase NimA-like FMN-containing flavoprotein (pyridoxamine 5'-phosphate oxidase superfamily)